MEIAKTFSFEAAHRLPRVPDGHPCGRTHGHSYRVEVVVEGVVDERAGWVVDFAELTNAWRAFVDKLDHQSLNDQLPNPTAENLAVWIANQFLLNLTHVVRLVSVTVWETATSRATYRP